MRNRKKITSVRGTCINAILFQSDLNKWRLSQYSKLDKLYINYAPIRLLQRSKLYFIEYKNQIFTSNSYIHLIACDDASSYRCPSPITCSNIPKRYCILIIFLIEQERMIHI